MLYKDLLPFVNHIKKYIRNLYVTGSFKRKEENINDLDFITKEDLNEIIDKFNYYYNIDILRQGNEYIRISVDLPKYNEKIKIDIWRASDNYEYNFLKWMRDIDKGHNIYLRKLAKQKGLTLSDRGLKLGDKYIHIYTKKNLIKALTEWKFEDKNFDNENNIRL